MRIIYLLAVTIAVSALLIRYAGFVESALLLAQIVMVYVIIMLIMRKAALSRGLLRGALTGRKLRLNDGRQRKTG